MNIWDSYGNWAAIADTSIDTIKKAICVDTWKPNVASRNLQNYIRSLEIDTVLDFGCGLGRNVPLLKTMFKRVLGLDIPQMLQHVPRGLYDNIGCSIKDFEIKDMVLYDSVCWQHIIDKDYIKMLAKEINESAIRNVVSLSLVGLNCEVVHSLIRSGWQIAFREDDAKSFEQNTHALWVLSKEH